MINVSKERPIFLLKMIKKKAWRGRKTEKNFLKINVEIQSFSIETKALRKWIIIFNFKSELNTELNKTEQRKENILISVKKESICMHERMTEFIYNKEFSTK